MRRELAVTKMAVMLIVLSGGMATYGAPAISFLEPPTPPDGASVTESSVEIEAQILEPALSSVTFNWAGTEYPIYDDSVVLMFNCDNVFALGEDYINPGGLVADASNWLNDGTVGIGDDPTTVPEWLSGGRYGGAFDFAGNGSTFGQSILVIPNADSLNPGSGDFAIAMWVRPRSDIDGDLLRKGSTNTGAATWYKLEHSPSPSNNRFSLNFNTDGTDATVTSPQAYNDDQWHYVLAQRRGNTAELWIDGALEGSATVSGSISNSANLTVGSKDDQNDDFINATLDEVRVYMRSFTEAEIQVLYNSNLSKAGTGTWYFYVNQTNLASGDYAYEVSAVNASSETSTASRSVTIDAAHSPEPPTLVSPENGAGNISTSPTLQVTVSDLDGGVLDVSFFGRQLASGGEEFTIIALPDTQKYAESYPDIFTSQTQWIVANKEALNIVFVTHEGDIVNAWNSTTQWDRANASMSLLDGVVPYSVVPGDHDHYGEDPPGSTEYYEQYFGASRFTGYSWWGGSYAGNYGGIYDETYPHTNNNNYQLLTIGGQDYIFLSLDFCPSQDEMDWANGILTTYSDRMAILTTHGLLDTSANYYGSGDFWLYPDGSSNPTGDTSLIWYDLIRNHENLQLVLCGHMHGEARRTDDNLAGKPVHQLLANYQGRTNGGNGFLRIMQFVPADDTVYVQTYSPWLNQYETDADSEFSLYLPMGGGPFLPIGADYGVPSGQDASIVWDGLSNGTDYEWFVEVTDPTERTTVGPVWSFTTALAPEASNPSPSNGATGVAVDVILSWDPGIDAVSHDVYFGTNPAPGTAEYKGSQTDTTYTPSVEPGTTYYWRIDEYDGYTTHQGYVWSFTTAPVPGQATNPNPGDGAADVSTDADLSWTAGNDTTSHDVYFGDTYPPPFVQNQSGTTYDPGTLAYRTDYYWRIDEIGPGGTTEGAAWSFTTKAEMPWSDDFESGDLAAGGWTVSGIAAASAKAAYSGVYGAELKDSASIERAISTKGFADINIKYARKTKGLDSGEFLYVEWSDGTWWHELEATQDTSWASQDMICGPAANDNPAFKLRFRSNAGNPSECGYIDNVQITGNVSGPDETPPSPDPMTWAVQPHATGSTSISMTATTASDPSGVEYYFACTAGGGHDSGWQDSPTYVDTGLQAGVQYTYQVKARDKSPNQNETALSSPASATPQDLPPAAPTGLSATPGDTQVTLEWDDNTEPDLDGYNVYRSETSGGPYTQLNGALVPASDYLDLAVANGTTYYYVVRAVDQALQESSNSNEASATPSSQIQVYINSIDMALIPTGKNWKATAKVSISPAQAGATVVADWYLNGSQIQTGATGLTDSSGYTKITSPPEKAVSGQVFRFVITDVVLSGYVYDPPVPDEASIAVP